MDKLERFKAATMDLSADERKALRTAMEYAVDLHDNYMLGYITDIAVARGRAIKRKQSDKRTDSERRTLIGARIRNEYYARCKDAAEEQGVSLYRFIVDALEVACLAVEKKVPPAAED